MAATAAKVAKTHIKKVPMCILRPFSLPLTIEEYRIVAEYPEVFSIDNPGRVALPMDDAQALGLWRFLE